MSDHTSDCPGDTGPAYVPPPPGEYQTRSVNPMSEALTKTFEAIGAVILMVGGYGLGALLAWGIPLAVIFAVVYAAVKAAS